MLFFKGLLESVAEGAALAQRKRTDLEIGLQDFDEGISSNYSEDGIAKAGRAARRAVQAWRSSKGPQCVSSSCHWKAEGALSFHSSLPACLMYLAAEGELAGAVKEPDCIKGMQEWLVAESSSAQPPQAHLGISFCQRARAQGQGWEVSPGFALLNFPALGLVLGNSIQWWLRVSSCLIWVPEVNDSFACVS